MHFDDQDPALAATANVLRADILRFKSKAANDKRGPLKLIAADFEFVYDMVSFRVYQAAENDATNGWVRWPFCHVVAAAWTTLTFPSEDAVPTIGPIVTLTADKHCERAIAEAFFAVAEQSPEAVLTSWGGEQKDWPVLRRVAAEQGMRMPVQLTDMRIHAPICSPPASSLLVMRSRIEWHWQTWSRANRLSPPHLRRLIPRALFCAMLGERLRERGQYRFPQKWRESRDWGLRTAAP